MLNDLSKFNRHKAAGPDEIPNWILRNFLTFVIPYHTISKCLVSRVRRACVAKVAERFVVEDYVEPVVLKGKSSTTMALVSMLRHWSLWTDGTGAIVRMILFDHRKAFIDYNINKTSYTN